MLKHMDFLLHADEDKIIKLRFYPRHSSLHLFDEGLKKAGSERTFGDVYKIYYSWAILLSENDYSYETDGHGELIKNEDGSYKTISNWTPYKQVFGFSCDECSALSEIGDLTRHVIAKRESIDDYKTFGQPGSDWNIRYNKGYTYDEYLREWYREDGYNVPDKTGKKKSLVLYQNRNSTNMKAVVIPICNIWSGIVMPGSNSTLI